MAAIDDLVSLLEGRAYRYGDEMQLQDAIQMVLAGQDVRFEREVVLTKKDRIDFLLPCYGCRGDEHGESIGIEVKIKAGLSEVTRQLHRYAQSTRIDAILFATTSRRLAALLPRTLNGKRIVSANLGGVL